MKGNKMNTFTNAVLNQEARTENGMKARKSSANKNVDLFYKIGASRGKNIVPDFVAALVENKDYALRIAQWTRDVRGGSGERKLFRDILLYLGKNDKDAAIALMNKVPEIGRWDDLLVEFEDAELKTYAYDMFRKALDEGNGLAAKWTPRKGQVAIDMRRHFGWTPKYYRKRLVELTKVVESNMCAKDWDNINFSHVPSVASSRYRKAFYRNTPKYTEYVEKLTKGDKSVKANASAIYPYDVIKDLFSYYGVKSTLSKTELDFITAQWEALPNYVGDASILPLVDVSGSMTSKIKNSNVNCLMVALSLGLYLADKNKGVFKDTFLTFSSLPELLHLKGDIVQKLEQMQTSKWEMSTNLHKAFSKILETAVKGKVPDSEMPKTLLILSDMQFNACVRNDDSAMEMIERKYLEAGYTVPNVVFWNLNSYDNTPVSYDKSGAALVSGFSPSIVKSVLSSKLENFTPENVMLQTIMNSRYDY